MDKLYITKRARPLKANGFTILEMMVVLLIVSILLSTTQLSVKPDGLSLFSKNLLLTIQSEQFKAFETRQSRQIIIDQHHYETQEAKINYPSSISCTPQILRFTNKGNISKGGSITCTQGAKQIRLVFQLGTGKGRIDHV